MVRIQVSNVEMLELKKVLAGSKYALEKLAIRGFWEKSLLLSRLPAADALLGLAPVSARFCLLKIPSFLIYLPVNQYFPYAFDIDLITVILFLHVSFNPCAKYLCPTKYIQDWQELFGESTKNIEKAVRRIWRVKPILLVPTICLLLKV